MSESICPIAYDHTEDLDVCMVCGWREAPDDPAEPAGTDRIREAIDRLSGRYAPTHPVLFAKTKETP